MKAKGQIRKVIKRFLEDLRAMESVIEKEESRMYSASLLFVYEGDQQALQDSFATERNIITSLDRKFPDGDVSTSAIVAISNDDLPKGNSTADDSGTDATVRFDAQDDEEDSEEVRFPAIQNLKLIDFAHAEWTPGQGPDENILHGIRNTTKILSSLAG